MPNNEEQRKPWLMLKKALKIEAFTSDIIPPFTTWTHTDKYGTWRCEQGGTPRGGSAVWAFGAKGKILHKNNNNYIESYTAKASPNDVYIILYLPEGASICNADVWTDYRDIGQSNLHGFNPLTGTWEYLGSMTQTLKNDVFYSAFKWWFKPGSSYGTSIIGTIQIRSGKIRYK